MLKDKSVGFYASCLSAVCGLIALILYFMNISNAYFADAVNTVVVACSVVAIALGVIYLVMGNGQKEQTVKTLVRGYLPVVMTFLFFTAFMLFLSTRVYSMAIIYGSSLEANNMAAQSAMTQAIITLVLYALAGMAAIVTGFSRTSKAR